VAAVSVSPRHDHADTLFELDAPPRIALERGLPLIGLSPLCGDMRWNIDTLLGLIDEVRELHPIWIIHGAQDEVVPVSVSEEMAQALRASGGEPRITIYSDEGHRGWGRAYGDPDFWKWLHAQKAAV
jgi:acetyl esterase/lipase